MDKRKFDDLVAYVRRNYTDYQRDLWEDPAKERAYEFGVVLPESARATFLAQLIEESSETKLAWDSVRRIAQERLRTGDSLPQELSEWVADVLGGKRPCPSKGAGITTSRNRMFTMAVWDLQQRFGLSPTISDNRDFVERQSACDVVAAAASVSRKTVEAAWTKRDDILS